MNAIKEKISRQSEMVWWMVLVDLVWNDPYNIYMALLLHWIEEEKHYFTSLFPVSRLALS